MKCAKELNQIEFVILYPVGFNIRIISNEFECLV